MILLAFLLLVLVAAIVVLMVLAGTAPTVRLEIDQLNLAWEPSALMVFLLGAGSVLLLGLALGMIRAGSRRKMAQRREIKELRKQAHSSPSSSSGTGTAGTTGTTGGGAIGSRPVTDSSRTTDVRDPLYVDRDR